MKRIASVVGLPAENVAEYERLHADVWPDVLARLSASNIVNYSIFRHDDLLFAYCEYVGDDFDADMAEMAADGATQRWWELCNPLQQPVVGRSEGEWWHALPEVFHLD